MCTEYLKCLFVRNYDLRSVENKAQKLYEHKPDQGRIVLLIK